MVYFLKYFAGAMLLSCIFAVSAQAQTGNAADLELRLSAIEDALRELRGTVEENDYRVRKLSEDMGKFQKDAEYRFDELSGNPAPKTPPAPKEEEIRTIPEADIYRPSENEKIPVNNTLSETTAGDGTLRAPVYQHPDYSSPRDLYNYAFRLLNQTKYEQSADAFGLFIKQYPKDPLIGNAHYWQGETHYIRRDYVNAADAFRQGFEVLPNGPKAPDNLLKLSMSLSALDRNKEACIVLSQIVSKYRRQSVGISDKAKSEQRRIGC